MTFTIQKTFGARLRQVRRLRGLSQDELARRISMEKSAISKYESGSRGLSVGTVIDLAATLNCSPAWLLFGGDDDVEVAVGGRTHRAADWWHWLAGQEPLPGENRREFFRAATVDIALSLQQAIQDGWPTPMAEFVGETFRPGFTTLSEFHQALRAAGYESVGDAVRAHPDWDDMDVATATKLLIAERIGPDQ